VILAAEGDGILRPIKEESKSLLRGEDLVPLLLRWLLDMSTVGGGGGGGGGRGGGGGGGPGGGGLVSCRQNATGLLLAEALSVSRPEAAEALDGVPAGDSPMVLS
jgi:hypothetical protein